jgi:GNAT superfamily N-acetyltransferase
VLARLRRAVTAHGIRGLASLAAHRTKHFVHSVRTLLVFRSAPSEILPPVTDDVPGLKFEIKPVVDPWLVDLIGRDDTFGSLRSAARGTSRESEVHYVTIDGTIAGWGLWCPGQGVNPLIETGTAVDIPVGDVALISFFVRPEYRGRRIYQQLLRGMAREALARSVRSLWIWCEVSNRPSKTAIERVGFRQCAIHTTRIVLGRRISTIRNK